MRAVLISIKPKWCELIALGEKTVEVRKSKPKLEVPFKCYIYCTIDGGVKGDTTVPSRLTCGKVIGEFVCDKIVEFENDWWDIAFYETAERACLSANELAIYLGKKDVGYGWHISDLVVYDKPMELGEFHKPIEEWIPSTTELMTRENAKKQDGGAANAKQHWRTSLEAIGMTQKICKN